MQLLLPLTSLLLVMGLWFIVRTTGIDPSMTLSLHALSRKRVRYLFAVLLSIVSIFLIIFNDWLTSTKQLGELYNYSFVFAMVCVLTIAWIPDFEGIQRKVHRTAAYGLVASLPTMTALIALAPSTDTFVVYYSWATFAIFMVLCYIVFFVPKKRKHFLYYQSFYISLIFGVLMVETYL